MEKQVKIYIHQMTNEYVKSFDFMYWMWINIFKLKQKNVFFLIPGRYFLSSVFFFSEPFTYDCTKFSIGYMFGLLATTTLYYCIARAHTHCNRNVECE